MSRVPGNGVPGQEGRAQCAHDPDGADARRVERPRRRSKLNCTLTDETDPALPPRTHPPSPTGESRDSGGVAQSRAMSAMETALLEMGSDSDGMVASAIEV
jgi:hypothetical protein